MHDRLCACVLVSVRVRMRVRWCVRPAGSHLGACEGAGPGRAGYLSAFTPWRKHLTSKKPAQVTAHDLKEDAMFRRFCAPHFVSTRDDKATRGAACTRQVACMTIA
eukprot:1800121-Pleurochrysis_carterae.AAC.2